MKIHRCHWPKCRERVSPVMWGCKKHWFTLPSFLRNKVWKAYRPGQEVDKNPSEKYLEVVKEVQLWIANFEAGLSMDEAQFEKFLEERRFGNKGE